MKRIVDIAISFFGLIIFLPILLPVIFMVWLQDKHSPFYIAKRVGKDHIPFNMVKLRSMIINAEQTGVDSTGSDDERITSIGRFIRKYKLDELTQLWNVLKGDMSLVGPRPNVVIETELYTDAEKILLTVRPGITDIASIVFSDEGDILSEKEDPDIAYNQLIRPGKNKLGLFYVDKQNIFLDIAIIWLTVLAIFSKATALKSLESLLFKIGASKELIEIASRRNPLMPSPPPGSDDIVVTRER
tara:strand:- start:8 stop:739 length:732 start_codon:yes stop_codon:yes gene_type:complete